MVHSRTPWVFRDLVEELDRMSRNVGWAYGSPGSSSNGLVVKDDEAALVIDLPGVAESDLELNLKDDVLHIKAHREDLHQQNEDVLLRERSFGEFSREIHLPWPVREEGVEATLKEGVLTLSFRRAPEAAPRQIKVKTS